MGPQSILSPPRVLSMDGGSTTRNTTPTARLEGARRIERWDHPEDVVREAVGNALVHRDYSIAGTDIMLTIFSNRLEVVSPERAVRGQRPGIQRLGTRQTQPEQRAISGSHSGRQGV